MTLVTNVVFFCIGSVIGHIGPRLPTLFMTRAKGFNLRFEPHPEPVTLSPYLTQRVLHMRTFYWLSLVLATIVLVFGAASLRWGSASFGFGLWLAASWLALSRVQTSLGGRSGPWTKAMAVELQLVMNRASGQQACCAIPLPVWHLQAVQCRHCKAVLAPLARPDLGRPRSDGRLRGFLRMLITDGYPLAEPLKVDSTSEE